MMAGRESGRRPDDSALLGACGLYCGACYHYRASTADGKHLLEAAVRQGRKLQGFTCKGCRSSLLYVHPGCAQCEIRACSDRHGVAHCGLCRAFPCERLQAFQSDGRIHHQGLVHQLEELAVMGAGLWLTAQARRWRCGCGAAYSWYETVCPSCGASLPSYGPDPMAPQLPDHGSDW